LLDAVIEDEGLQGKAILALAQLIYPDITDLTVLQIQVLKLAAEFG
jgi:hypothetical protein